MIRNRVTFSPVASNRPITVLLAEDHMVLREGLRTLLGLEPDIEVVGEAETGRQAVELAMKLKPSVILMDIAMPSLNGLEATKQIRLAVPDTKILILSAHSDDAYVEQIIQLGASGYLIKQTSFQSLAKAVREVHKGNQYFSPSITKHFGDRPWKATGKEAMVKKSLDTLSSREAEVLQLVAEGGANKNIASELGISIKTVEKHREHLMRKLGLHDIAGITRYAIAAGVIESSVQLTIL